MKSIIIFLFYSFLNLRNCKINISSVSFIPFLKINKNFINCDLIDNNGVIHSFLPIENDKDSNDLFYTINYFINHKNEYEIPTNEQELDNRFFNAINKLNLPESARHALLNENDISKKWVIIVQYHNPTHLDINTESLLDDIKSVLIFIF